MLLPLHPQPDAIARARAIVTTPDPRMPRAAREHAWAVLKAARGFTGSAADASPRAPAPTLFAALRRAEPIVHAAVARHLAARMQDGGAQ